MTAIKMSFSLSTRRVNENGTKSAPAVMAAIAEAPLVCCIFMAEEERKTVRWRIASVIQEASVEVTKRQKGKVYAETQ